LTLHQLGGQFASVTAAKEEADPKGVSLVRLLEGDKGKAFLVVWPPDTPPQECMHGSDEESALVLAGKIVDEDGTEHGPGDAWWRPAGEVHRPRSGPEGAELLLWRFGGA
jgi:quercetin dioxygenase-like cupin family protein